MDLEIKKMSKRVDVLLVEDDACLARAILRQLHVRGIRVQHCATVEAAARLNLQFRVGVFDIELPDGNGVALARRLLSQKVVTRAVFNTGCLDPDLLAQARSLGQVFGKLETRPLVSSLLAPAASAALSPSVASCAARSKVAMSSLSSLTGT